MIETIYKATCDVCNERSQQNPMSFVRNFTKLLDKIGWRRSDGKWICPFCVRSLSAERPSSVRKDPPKKSSKPNKLSKTAREALAQRMIDDEG